MTRLVLASASPRRRDLLAAAGLDPLVMPAGVDETVEAGTADPARAAKRLALDKAEPIAATHPGDIVVGADTMVVLGGEILAKPADAAEARDMLERLRGRAHQVITGVAIARDNEKRVDHATTGVQMRDYSDAEITAYIERGEPFDKAGGYAIQDAEFRPVASLHGCYCNVVGLPLRLTLRLIASIEPRIVPSLAPRLPQCDQCPFR